MARVSSRLLYTQKENVIYIANRIGDVNLLRTLYKTQNYILLVNGVFSMKNPLRQYEWWFSLTLSLLSGVAFLLSFIILILVVYEGVAIRTFIYNFIATIVSGFVYAFFKRLYPDYKEIEALIQKIQGINFLKTTLCESGNTSGQQTNGSAEGSRDAVEAPIEQ